MGMSTSITSLGEQALEIVVDGRLRKDDYLEFRRRAEKCLETQGTINLLFRIRRFGGMSAAALWEDLKFDVSHYRDVGKLALVDDGADAQWIATVSKPFTRACVEHFNSTEIAEARAWVRRN